MSDGPLFPIIDGHYHMEREPMVRIGVVLAEDHKRQLDFHTEALEYHLEIEGLASGGPVDGLATRRLSVVVAEADRVELHEGVPARASRLIASGAIIRLIPGARPGPTRPGDGTLVHAIVAGRGFHWFKHIDQTLTGTLEFRARDGHLIVVNELPVEEYLTGVITGEMSGECPIEYMKAQAVAARSWLLGQPRPIYPGEPFQFCNDDNCQRYQGTGGWTPRAIEAIAGCRGEVLITASNRYCDARYSKSTGGISEDARHVWHEEIEGLEARVDAPMGSHIERFFPVTEANIDEYIRGEWLKQTDAYASPAVVPEETICKYLGRVDEAGHYFRWSQELSHDDLCDALQSRGGLRDLLGVDDLVPLERGRSGRIKRLEVRYVDQGGNEKSHILDSEYKIRAGLWTKFLYSSCFIIDKKRDAAGRLEGVTLHGGGWGHGAGMCQIGGLGRALQGQDYRTILLHYFSNVRLERIYQ
jgi:SpoIID/LytB domain protein